VPYLTLEAFRFTINFIAGLSPAAVSSSTMASPLALPFLEKLAHELSRARVQLAGEPSALLHPARNRSELTAFRTAKRLGSSRSTPALRNRTDNLKLLGFRRPPPQRMVSSVFAISREHLRDELRLE